MAEYLPSRLFVAIDELLVSPILGTLVAAALPPELDPPHTIALSQYKMVICRVLRPQSNIGSIKPIDNTSLEEYRV
jgi:hypothetical protein